MTADEVARWAAALPEGDERAEREREFAGLYATHDRMLREQGALDFGDLLLRAVALLQDSPTSARGSRRAGATCSSTTHQDLELAGLRLVLAAGRRARRADRRRRRRPGRAPRARRGAQNLRDLAGALPGARSVRLERSLRAPASDPGGRAGRRRADRGPHREGGRRRRRAATCASGAARTSARRRRAWRPRSSGSCARAWRPSEIGVLVRSVRNEGQAVAVALEERAVPYRLVGAAAFFERAEVKRRARLAAAARRPRRRGRRRARAGPPAGRAALDRPRPLRADRPAAQARHGRRAGRRHRVAAAAARGARADPRLPQAPPLGRRRARHDAPRPLRPPPHRPPRPAPPAALRRAGRRRRAAACRSRAWASWPPSSCAARPQATPREFARYVAAVAEAGLRDDEEAARRGRATARSP